MKTIIYDEMNKQDSIRIIKEELKGIEVSDIALIIEFLNRLAQIEYDNYVKTSQ